MRWNIDVQKNCAGTSTIVVPARFVGVPLRLSVFQILDLVMHAEDSVDENTLSEGPRGLNNDSLPRVVSGRSLVLT